MAIEYSTISAMLFLGGWLSPVNNYLFCLIPGTVWVSIKICIGVIIFITTRAILPRYRYDQLMSLGWKCFLPLSLGYFIFTLGVLVSFNWFLVQLF